ncbi:MAG: ribbon-helix-helix protein, CopG family [Pseudonocardiaceae bacterium]
MSGKKERITVSLDPSVAAELKAAAERAGAASVSEYV